MKKTLVFYVFLLLSSIVNAQDSTVIEMPVAVDVDFDTITTVFQKITEYDEMILITNMDTLCLNKRMGEDIPAKIIFLKNGKDSLKFKLKVQARGKFRRRVCELPPLKLDFRKKQLVKRGLFNGCDKLKLVTHCQNNELSEQVLTKEFWVYKMYNQLTENSFRIHPLKVTYIHSEKPEEKIVGRAFFLESNEELSYRLKGELVEEWGSTREQTVRESYYNTLLFQYMIGNTDWDVSTFKNIKLLRKKGAELLTVIPYDFDYSAVVKAPYARLNRDHGQKKFEERVVQGKFANKKDLTATAQRFLDLTDTGFYCYKNCPILSPYEKKRIKKYIKSFCKIIKSRKLREELFLE